MRRLLGRGGFAEVYAAWDIRLKREVAVKVLRPELGLSSVLLERFRREAEAAATLRHPNVIPVFAVGEREGLAYLIMPLIQGETLRELLDRQGRVPVAEARRVLAEVAAALETAHEAGLIHRDIKPENIMLEGKERRVLLMDFGIAKPTISGGETLTETGLIVGTPYYMSPEQAAGDRQLDHRADQYSLAAVGYEMLAGRRPFDGDSAQRVLHQQLTASPKRLETLVDLPTPFAAIIERGLAKDPADRFANVAEMRAALRGLELASDSGMPGAAEPAQLTPAPALGLGVGAVLGTLIYLLLYPANHPEAGTFAGVRREAAESIATALFARQGAVGAFNRVASVDLVRPNRAPVTDGRTVLMEALGPRAAVEWARQRLPFWEFRVRWSDPARRERWEAGVATNYQLVEFSAAAPAQSSGDSIPVDSAEAIARAFLRTVGLDPSQLIPSDRRDLDRGTGHEFVWEDPAQQISTLAPAVPVGIVRAAVTVRGRWVAGFRRYFHSLRPAEEMPIVQLRDMVALFSALALLLSVMILLVQTLSRKGSAQLRAREVLRLSLVAALITMLGRFNSLPQIKFEFAAGDLGGVVVSFIGPALIVLLIMLPLGLLGEQLARDELAPNLVGVLPLLRGELVKPPVVTAGLCGTALGLVALGLRALTDAGAHTWDSSWRPRFDAPMIIFNYLSPSTDLAVTALSEGLVGATVLLAILAIAHHYLRRLPLTILAGGVAGALLGWLGDNWLAAGVLGLLWAWGFVRLGLLSCFVGLFVASVGNRGMELVTSGAGNRPAMAATTLVLLLLPLVTALALRRGGHSEARARVA